MACVNIVTKIYIAFALFGILYFFFDISRKKCLVHLRVYADLCKNQQKKGMDEKLKANLAKGACFVSIIFLQ